MGKREILAKCKEEKVRFLRLTFTDIDGVVKNVEVPTSQFDKALDGQIMFDGSSIEGFTRIEESDMLLQPDLATFCIYPWSTPHGRVGRLICDVYTSEGEPFEGCPRTTLKRVVARAAKKGWTMMAGPEAEFFLFKRDENGRPNHEVAPAQHEIDFKYGDAVATADNLVTFRFVVKKVALDHGLHATFMPKPIFGVNGSGMHTHQSLFDRKGGNVFYDPKGPYQLSKVARGYIGGILEHARAFSAVTNPLVNSYKRLVPGYEAPVYISWGQINRSALIRVPQVQRTSEVRCT